MGSSGSGPLENAASAAGSWSTGGSRRTRSDPEPLASSGAAFPKGGPGGAAAALLVGDAEIGTKESAPLLARSSGSAGSALAAATPEEAPYFPDGEASTA